MVNSDLQLNHFTFTNLLTVTSELNAKLKTKGRLRKLLVTENYVKSAILKQFNLNSSGKAKNHDFFEIYQNSQKFILYIL